METLVDFMGGPATFESRLDIMFQPGVAKQNLGANGAGITTLMNIGWVYNFNLDLSGQVANFNNLSSNEPDFMTPYLYNYINKQAKSVQISRSLANDL